MSWRKLSTLILTAVLLVSVISGCGSKNDNETTNTGNANAAGEGTASDEVVDLEVWYTNLGYKPIEKGSVLYNFYKDELGVGIIHPYVEWNGGTTYLNQLNMKIAANEMPDLFYPQQGIEASLAKNGAIADLTELLPKYAPNLWNAIPQDVWNIVKANDPTGQGRIYYVPGVLDYGRMGGLIRTDWLEKLGLSMPKTQEEYVKVLEAFRDGDPNGNGVKDEIPTGGREEAKWMDHLFAMYGIAMNEGKPDWDIYNGELTYSAVTQNMKDALAFIADLYKRGLIDPETLLNNKAAWDGKIDSDKVGNYYHWAEDAGGHIEKIFKNTNVKGDYAVMPIPEVPGYEGQGFYTLKKMQSPVWVVKNNKDEEKLLATMKLLNNLYDKSKWEDLFYGAEGMHHTVKDGKKVSIAPDKSTQENKLFQPFNDLDTLEYKSNLLKNAMSEEREWALGQNIRNMEENQKYVKTIAGDGLPASIYDGYADINNRTLYVEYATKIILGQYSIDKFDEFVKKWNESGGEEVTKRAREWYAKVKN
ncbi:ABC transporter substrate-binding protein [Paenibacillus sp. HB172176]|uniref:ABC transporter substrate-binding protein n=1 Tax=Paenibacillus sp. HB172176 TaxID=2493690 RepID=UPI00143BBAEC|nr:ABC transporter substrate-binding protein [Paenibacillus sp. HB172176]